MLQSVSPTNSHPSIVVLPLQKNKVLLLPGEPTVSLHFYTETNYFRHFYCQMPVVLQQQSTG